MLHKQSENPQLHCVSAGDAVSSDIFHVNVSCYRKKQSSLEHFKIKTKFRYFVSFDIFSFESKIARSILDLLAQAESLCGLVPADWMYNSQVHPVCLEEGTERKLFLLSCKLQLHHYLPPNPAL